MADETTHNLFDVAAEVELDESGSEIKPLKLDSESNSQVEKTCQNKSRVSSYAARKSRNKHTMLGNLTFREIAGKRKGVLKNSNLSPRLIEGVNLNSKLSSLLNYAEYKSTKSDISKNELKTIDPRMFVGKTIKLLSNTPQSITIKFVENKSPQKLKNHKALFKFKEVKVKSENVSNSKKPQINSLYKEPADKESKDNFSYGGEGKRIANFSKVVETPTEQIKILIKSPKMIKCETNCEQNLQLKKMDRLEENSSSTQLNRGNIKTSYICNLMEKNSHESFTGMLLPAERTEAKPFLYSSPKYGSQRRHNNPNNQSELQHLTNPSNTSSEQCGYNSLMYLSEIASEVLLADSDEHSNFIATGCQEDARKSTHGIVKEASDSFNRMNTKEMFSDVTKAPFTQVENSGNLVDVKFVDLTEQNQVQKVSGKEFNYTRDTLGSPKLSSCNINISSRELSSNKSTSEAKTKLMRNIIQYNGKINVMEKVETSKDIPTKSQNENNSKNLETFLGCAVQGKCRESKYPIKGSLEKRIGVGKFDNQALSIKETKPSSSNCDEISVVKEIYVTSPNLTSLAQQNKNPSIKKQVKANLFIKKCENMIKNKIITLNSKPKLSRITKKCAVITKASTINENLKLEDFEEGQNKSTANKLTLSVIESKTSDSSKNHKAYISKTINTTNVPKGSRNEENSVILTKEKTRNIVCQNKQNIYFRKLCTSNKNVGLLTTSSDYKFEEKNNSTSVTSPFSSRHVSCADVNLPLNKEIPFIKPCKVLLKRINESINGIKVTQDNVMMSDKSDLYVGMTDCSKILEDGQASTKFVKVDSCPENEFKCETESNFNLKLKSKNTHPVEQLTQCTDKVNNHYTSNLTLKGEERKKSINAFNDQSKGLFTLSDPSSVKCKLQPHVLVEVNKSTFNCNMTGSNNCNKRIFEHTEEDTTSDFNPVVKKRRSNNVIHDTQFGNYQGKSKQIPVQYKYTSKKVKSPNSSGMDKLTNTYCKINDTASKSEKNYVNSDSKSLNKSQKGADYSMCKFTGNKHMKIIQHSPNIKHEFALEDTTIGILNKTKKDAEDSMLFNSTRYKGKKPKELSKTDVDKSVNIKNNKIVNHFSRENEFKTIKKLSSNPVVKKRGRPKKLLVKTEENCLDDTYKETHKSDNINRVNQFPNLKHESALVYKYCPTFKTRGRPRKTPYVTEGRSLGNGANVVQLPIQQSSCAVGNDLGLFNFGCKGLSTKLRGRPRKVLKRILKENVHAKHNYENLTKSSVTSVKSNKICQKQFNTSSMPVLSHSQEILVTDTITLNSSKNMKDLASEIDLKMSNQETLFNKDASTVEERIQGNKQETSNIICSLTSANHTKLLKSKERTKKKVNSVRKSFSKERTSNQKYLLEQNLDVTIQNELSMSMDSLNDLEILNKSNALNETVMKLSKKKELGRSNSCSNLWNISFDERRITRSHSCTNLNNINCGHEQLRSLRSLSSIGVISQNVNKHSAKISHTNVKMNTSSNRKKPVEQRKSLPVKNKSGLVKGILKKVTFLENQCNSLELPEEEEAQNVINICKNQKKRTSSAKVTKTLKKKQSNRAVIHRKFSSKVEGKQERFANSDKKITHRKSRINSVSIVTRMNNNQNTNKIHKCEVTTGNSSNKNSTLAEPEVLKPKDCEVEDTEIVYTHPWFTNCNTKTQTVGILETTQVNLVPFPNYIQFPYTLIEHPTNFNNKSNCNTFPEQFVPNNYQLKESSPLGVYALTSQQCENQNFQEYPQIFRNTPLACHLHISQGHPLINYNTKTNSTELVDECMSTSLGQFSNLNKQEVNIVQLNSNNVSTPDLRNLKTTDDSPSPPSSDIGLICSTPFSINPDEFKNGEFHCMGSKKLCDQISQPSNDFLTVSPIATKEPFLDIINSEEKESECNDSPKSKQRNIRIPCRKRRKRNVSSFNIEKCDLLCRNTCSTDPAVTPRDELHPIALENSTKQTSVSTEPRKRSKVDTVLKESSQLPQEDKLDKGICNEHLKGLTERISPDVNNAIHMSSESNKSTLCESLNVNNLNVLKQSTASVKGSENIKRQCITGISDSHNSSVPLKRLLKAMNYLKSVQKSNEIIIVKNSKK